MAGCVNVDSWPFVGHLSGKEWGIVNGLTGEIAHPARFGSREDAEHFAYQLKLEEWHRETTGR